MAKEILTVLININPVGFESIKEKAEMDFGTTNFKHLTHEVSPNFEVRNIPASCQKMLNNIEDLSDNYGVEFYQGLKVVLNHTDLVVLVYLVKELKKRSIRVFDKNLREFI